MENIKILKGVTDMDAASDGNIKGLANIKKVVVLMFENRSFDHVFGAFPGVNGLMLDGKINPDYYNLKYPLQPSCPTSNPKIHPVPVDPDRPMQRDFNHDFGDGAMPDLFGPIFTIDPPGGTAGDYDATYYSGYAQGKPLCTAQPDQPTYPPTNSGFYSTYQCTSQQGQAALTYFEHDALKILPVLAKNFVLCDNWYCDMPGHTLPNRAFIHCGTTGSVYIDDYDTGTDTSPTIFERIDQVSPGDWKIYTPVTQTTESLHGEAIEVATLGQLDTRFLNENVSNYKGAPITDFAIDCEAGTLPFYSFIMCWLKDSTAWTDTSMHPSSMLHGGENLLAAVYNTLRESKSWDETLLVVTFDENGGIYDHVMPPKTVPPDPARPIIQENDQSGSGNKWSLNSKFDFSLLGPRIPAILISPWLKAGIDNHQYQNTSVIRFLIDRLNSQLQANLKPLTERDKCAPQLDSAFARFGTDTRRDDCPYWIEPYARLPTKDPATGSDAIPYSDGRLGIWHPPCGTQQAAPPCHTTEVLGIYLGSLPGHADTGKPITRTFETNAEVASYMQERLDAAAQVRHASPR